MAIGTQLRRAKLSDHYDVIVIGSGIGGLTTAACLAKAGKKVLVLERHYTAGGFTHTYERKGFEWDVGVHYIGEVHRKGSTLRRVFDYISDEQLQWAEMDGIYDRIYIGSESFDYVKGEKQFRDRMVGYFPAEKNAIEQYLKLVKKVHRSSSAYYLERALPPWLGKIFFKKLTRRFSDFAEKTTEEVLLTLTKNRKLIAVLTGQWGDYGLPPSQSSFAMHALVANHYMGGAAYPVGGSSSIASTIESVIVKYGGQVITCAEVQSILTRNSKATGVKLSNGLEIKAKSIVSGVGAINTFQKLLSGDVAEKFKLPQKLRQVNPSLAHMDLYIGLKGTREDLDLHTTNLWIYPNENVDLNIQEFNPKPNFDFPAMFISFPSTKDPLWETNHPGKSTIEIIVPTPFAWFEKWQDTKWQKRGAEYSQFKKDMTERLLAILLDRFPHLKDKIQYVELSSPLSTAHFTGHRKGEMYGLDHSPQRFQQRWLRTDTPVKNLYLTGQDIVSCGVSGGLCAGVLTAIRVLGPIRSFRLIKLMKTKSALSN